MLLLAMTVAWYQLESRAAVLYRAEGEAAMLAGSLAQHADGTIEVIDMLLESLADRLKGADHNAETLSAINEALGNQLRRTTRIRSIAAYDADGRLIISSQPQVPDWSDFQNGDDFGFHRQNYTDPPRIGEPQRSHATGEWFIPVSKRLNGVNGKFEGVLIGTISISYFSKLYERLHVFQESNITLMNSDGTLMTRYPVDDAAIGRNFSQASWFIQTQTQGDGAIRFESPVDQVARIYGFAKVGRLPLTMFVGSSIASVLAAWRQAFILSSVSAVGLIGAFGVFGWRLASQVQARQDSEVAMSRLARTDGLTGLMNRRAFDAALLTMWESASLTGKPLSLLLLDVDHFKIFNDTNGHPAGDACLVALANALRKALLRPRDFIARYGGEEFAILLPDTDEASARIVADRLRTRVAECAMDHPDAPDAVVTISVGCATCRDQSARDGISAFLVGVDRALYRAKAGGRNRVECVSV
jgi:diguanylate cyclase (GGDEF)-like protein